MVTKNPLYNVLSILKLDLVPVRRFSTWDPRSATDKLYLVHVIQESRHEDYEEAAAVLRVPVAGVLVIRDAPLALPIYFRVLPQVAVDDVLLVGWRELKLLDRGSISSAW